MIEKAVRIGLANLLLLGAKMLVAPFLVEQREPEAEYDAEARQFRVVQ